MINNNSNIDSSDLNKEINSLPEIELPFTKSKDEVWNELNALIGEEEIISQPPQIKQKIKITWIQIAAAAVVALFISISCISFFYTKSIATQAGEHRMAFLPDGSSIEINAKSTIKYKPLWWRFNREVNLDGEAFFKVQKGKSFTVSSSLGKTIVLGTSFNIYARKSNYKVTCYTGKVKVVSIHSGHSTHIIPNEYAEINKDGTIALRQLQNADENISWINNMFVFTATPINLVFEEIQRQYNVTIISSKDLNYHYSGNFTRNRSVEEVLNMICRPLGLSYKLSKAGYVVGKENNSE